MVSDRVSECILHGDQFTDVSKLMCLVRYRLSAQSNRGKPNKPIYGSSTGQNFSDWISAWTLELVSKVYAAYRFVKEDRLNSTLFFTLDSSVCSEFFSLAVQ